ncbi:MAG: type II toxin-antitoxin system HicB family antitoxin [Chroococcales cyanobacterium]
MEKQKYIYWQDEDMLIGYLEEYPDYWTQGESLEELQENLLDIYKELNSGHIPSVRKVAELEVS